jgi:hypothetical protein
MRSIVTRRADILGRRTGGMAAGGQKNGGPLPAAADGRDRGRDGTTAAGTAGTAGGNADGEPRRKGNDGRR